MLIHRQMSCSLLPPLCEQPRIGNFVGLFLIDSTPCHNAQASRDRQIPRFCQFTDMPKFVLASAANSGNMLQLIDDSRKKWWIRFVWIWIQGYQSCIRILIRDVGIRTPLVSMSGWGWGHYILAYPMSFDLL